MDCWLAKEQTLFLLSGLESRLCSGEEAGEDQFATISLVSPSSEL